MGGELGYEDAIALLRRRLAESTALARACAWRARSNPRLLSERSWGELARIEALLVGRLEQALSRELRVEPWTAWTRVAAARQTLRRLVGGERALVVRLRSELSAAPLEAWRRGAPQLEAALWSFLVPRTHYLANTLALALDEPAPFPACMWHPREGRFRSRGG